MLTMHSILYRIKEYIDRKGKYILINEKGRCGVTYDLQVEKQEIAEDFLHCIGSI